ncbi:MAG TPA: hypothetical protein VN493_18785 [Thermoanaerobaculia bacterium]|nr:hypothetical protein [Thermoanaerobaculia bacterium]
MLKKSFAFYLLSLVLFLGAEASLYAQKDPGFTFHFPVGQIEAIPDSKLPELPDASNLTPAELSTALQNSCGSQEIGTLTNCEAWTGPNCTGIGFAIPCNFQITPGPFLSFATGCTTNYARLTSNNQLFQFLGFPPNICINAPAGDSFNLVACTTP